MNLYDAKVGYDTYSSKIVYLLVMGSCHSLDEVLPSMPEDKVIKISPTTTKMLSNKGEKKKHDPVLATLNSGPLKNALRLRDCVLGAKLCVGK